MHYLSMWKIGVEIIFGFSLCAIFLQVVLVTYFGKILRELGGLRLLEDNKMYYYQYWKLVSILVNFQNQTIIV